MAHVLRLRPKARHVNDGEKRILNSSNMQVQKDGDTKNEKNHLANGGFLVQEIKAGSKRSVSVRVRSAPMTIVWEFCTHKFDISFGARFETRTGSIMEVQALRRVKSNILGRANHYTAKRTGTLTLMWDNSYSKIRSKRLYFKVYQSRGCILEDAHGIERVNQSLDMQMIGILHNLWEVAVEQLKRREALKKSMAARKDLVQALNDLTESQRARLWLHDSRAIYKRAQKSVHYYEDLQANLPRLSKELQGVIQRDVQGVLHNSTTPHQRDVARRVLCCFALRASRLNRAVEYVQAMTYFVALSISAGLREKETFWLLTTFVEDWSTYFVDDLTNLKVDLLCLNALLLKHMSKLFYHLHRLRVEIDWFVSSMLECAFARNLPQSFLRTVWDLMFMVRQPVVVFSGVLMFFQVVQDRLLKCTTSEEALKVLSSQLELWRKSDQHGKDNTTANKHLELLIFWMLRMMDEDIGALRNEKLKLLRSNQTNRMRRFEETAAPIMLDKTPLVLGHGREELRYARVESLPNQTSSLTSSLPSQTSSKPATAETAKPSKLKYDPAKAEALRAKLRRMEEEEMASETPPAPPAAAAAGYTYDPDKARRMREQFRKQDQKDAEAGHIKHVESLPIGRTRSGKRSKHSFGTPKLDDEESEDDDDVPTGGVATKDETTSPATAAARRLVFEEEDELPVGRRRRAKRPKEVFRSAGSFTDAELEIEIEDWSDGQWVKQKKNVRVSQSSGSETADTDMEEVEPSEAAAVPPADPEAESSGAVQEVIDMAWERHCDEDSQAYFFYSRTTQKTVWEEDLLQFWTDHH